MSKSSISAAHQSSSKKSAKQREVPKMCSFCGEPDGTVEPLFVCDGIVVDSCKQADGDKFAHQECFRKFLAEKCGKLTLAGVAFLESLKEEEWPAVACHGCCLKYTKMKCNGITLRTCIDQTKCKIRCQECAEPCHYDSCSFKVQGSAEWVCNRCWQDRSSSPVPSPSRKSS